VDFFYVDTMVFMKLAHTELYLNRDGEEMYQEQKDWLRKELNASTADWKVVLGHHPLFTSGHHRSQAIVGGPLRGLDDIMREFGVTLYFAGHNHNTEVIQYKGVTYVTSGNGAKSYSDDNGNCFRGCGPNFVPWDAPADFTKHFDCAGGFVGLEFTSAKKAELIVYDRFGKPFDAATYVLQNSPPPKNPETLSSTVAASATVRLCSNRNLKRVEFACSDCEVLPAPTSGMTCENYCGEHGLSCVGASRSLHSGKEDVCGVRNGATCTEQAKEGQEHQDLICQCGAGVVVY